ncbi:MAG: hypothetical protein LUH07_03100 [Lachnospiraceae bacterium]|nr:hypothetical protein [Lachnospiraceae bacterium]
MEDRNDRFIDFMRYFLFGLAIALLILLAVIVFGIYRGSTRELDDLDDAEIIIVDDTEALTSAVEESEAETESEQQTEQNAAIETETLQTETSVGTEASQEDSSMAAEEETTADNASETDSSEENTEFAESTGDYRTLLQACNFRSAAAYEDEDGNDTTIASYAAGTELELLEDLGGWSRVKIDGVVGYVGSQFVSSAE